jgi:hypothetical protein
MDNRLSKHSLRRAIGSGAIVFAGFLAAGCGGGSATAGVANVGTSTTTTSTAGTAGDSGSAASLAADQLRYARCMQTHGEPNYPEPTGNFKATVRALDKLDPNSPKFQTAAKGCRNDLPTGGSASPAERAKVQTEALRFATCMQSHGMVNWPDPTSTGGYMVAPVGAAAESPTYLKAAKICAPLLPSG